MLNNNIKRKDNTYKFMIWKEDYVEKTLLHLVRRKSSGFRDVNKIRKNPDLCFYYKENLPITIDTNDGVKQLIKDNFPGKDYEISGNTILIFTNHIPQLHELIEQFFNEYQE